MDINWLGQSCFKIKGKNSSLIIDPYNPEATGLKLPKEMNADLLLVTHQHQDHNFISAVSDSPLVISGPGEYEKLGVSVVGTGTFHDKEQGALKGTNTIYQIMIDGISIVHLGDLGHVLTEGQLGEIDPVDILMIPVGGGPTIDAEMAAKVVSQLEPKIVILMHYKIDGLKYELEGKEAFLKEMGAENIESQPKLSVTRDKLPETTTVVVLSKT